MESVTEALRRFHAGMPGQENALAGALVLGSGTLFAKKSTPIGSRAARDRKAADIQVVPAPPARPAPPLIALSPACLEANRIIAFDPNALQSRYYDMLRNHLLRGRAKGQRQTIAVTAPKRGCGATSTAVNLAFSLARLQGTSVLLVDANFQDPAVARVLDLPPMQGSAAPGQYSSSRLVEVEMKSVRTHVLTDLYDPSRVGQESDAARATALIDRARQTVDPSIIVLDLPPVLGNDEALPHILEADTALVVLAVGESRLSDLEACRTFLGSKAEVQFVLNKSRDLGAW